MTDHTPESLHDFAVKHAPALSAEITRLCGQVIAKGMTGILEEVCRLQLERDQLADALQAAQCGGQGELPPLPEPFMELHADVVPAVRQAWVDQMQAYARAALAQQARTHASKPPEGMVVVPVDALVRWRDAFAEELAAMDIDPPIHHVKVSHDEIAAMLAARPKGGE